MAKRVNLLAQKNGGIEGLVAVETWIEKSFDPKLLELIRVRVSQMNGCAHCLHMHRQDALKQGETEDRLLLLNAWHESQLYTERERAALAWAAFPDMAVGSACRRPATAVPPSVYTPQFLQLFFLKKY